MTEQQDFLTALQDPDEYKVIQGIRAFEEHYGTLILGSSHADMLEEESAIRLWRLVFDIQPNSIMPHDFINDLRVAIEYYNKDFSITFQNPPESGDQFIGYVTLSRNPCSGALLTSNAAKPRSGRVLIFR